MKLSQKGIWLGAAGLVVLLCALVARLRSQPFVYPPRNFARSAPAPESAVQPAPLQIDHSTQHTKILANGADSPEYRQPVNIDSDRVDTAVSDSRLSATVKDNSLGVRRNLNSVSPLTPAGTETTTAAQGQPAEAHLPAPFLPLPNARNLNADDAEAVGSLAKQFTDAVVGPSSGPDTPEYYNRWMDAEWLANERYRSYFGFEAYNSLRDSGE